MSPRIQRAGFYYTLRAFSRPSPKREALEIHHHCGLRDFGTANQADGAHGERPRCNEIAESEMLTQRKNGGDQERTRS